MSTSVLFFITALILVKDALSQNCGASPAENSFGAFIMNGEKVAPGDFPWMVALMKNEAFTCTAFMIDSRHVLSAAHCFDSTDPRLYSASIGSIYYANGTRYGIVKIVLHEGYESGYFYDDIAMLTLEREVHFPGFYPLCLPFEQTSRHNLEVRGATVVGWGASRPDGPPSPVLMRLSSIPVTFNRECDKEFRQLGVLQEELYRGITHGILCAGFPEGGKDSCQGDSGGPLMLRDNGHWTVVGIVSFGFECGVPGLAAGYTRVSFYMNWIRSKMRS